MEYAGKKRITRRERFIGEMEQGVPWSMGCRGGQFGMQTGAGIGHPVFAQVGQRLPVAILNHPTQNQNRPGSAKSARSHRKPYAVRRYPQSAATTHRLKTEPQDNCPAPSAASQNAKARSAKGQSVRGKGEVPEGMIEGETRAAEGLAVIFKGIKQKIQGRIRDRHVVCRCQSPPSFYGRDGR